MMVRPFILSSNRATGFSASLLSKGDIFIGSETAVPKGEAVASWSLLMARIQCGFTSSSGLEAL